MFEIIETESKETVMNALVTLNGGEAVTMTSLELVEFINGQRGEGEAELRHDHFMAKVPQVLGETVAPNFRGYYKASNGKQNPMYRLPKREACLMAMSYSYDLQAKVFDRMTALEARPIDPMQVLSDPAAMRGLLLTYTEKVLTLEAKVEEQAPKVAALDRIATQTEGAVNLRIAAKLLQVPEKQFLQFANAKGFIFRNHFSHTWQGYADKAKAGLVELKLTTVERDYGSTKTVEQVLITRPGLAKLAQMLGVSMPHNNRQVGISA